MKNFQSIALIAVVVAGAGFYLFYLSGSALPEINAPSTENPVAEGTNPPAQAGELVVEDVKVGEGAEAKSGSTVTVHYLGTLADGTKFDSSYDRNEPFSFVLGEGKLIPGWEQGIMGMKVGGKRKLTIPPNLAYGANGVPNVIPPNSTLNFEVEMLEVK